jgi:hypothetical protein
MRVLRFLCNRLREVSTWRALIALATVAGLSLAPDQVEAVVVAGVALAALLEAFLPDPAGRIDDRVRAERVREHLPPAPADQPRRGQPAGGGDTHLGDFGSSD